jgi:hypothetical protein
MEIKVMILLNFKFYTVTPSSYIHVLVQVLGLDDVIATAALYMTSLSMMESDSIGVKPSLTAAAAGKNKQTNKQTNQAVSQFTTSFGKIDLSNTAAHKSRRRSDEGQMMIWHSLTSHFVCLQSAWP